VRVEIGTKEEAILYIYWILQHPREEAEVSNGAQLY